LNWPTSPWLIEFMEFLQEFVVTATFIKLIRVGAIFTIAWLLHRLAPRIAGLFLRLNRLFSFGGLEPIRHMTRWSQLDHLLPPELKSIHALKQEREATLRQLVASALSLTVFVVACIASLSLFVAEETVVWVVGLAASALAFAGRTDIGDFLAGINIIFQDRFNVGEKIIVKAQLQKIEGVVEHVSLNATWLRAQTGELYIIANGEFRYIGNYSRGLFSAANMSITIPTADLNRALPLLRKLGEEAVELIPGLIEPWQVVNESGSVGQHVELTLIVQAKFGQAADLRPRLLTLVQERLALADIAVAGKKE